MGPSNNHGQTSSIDAVHVEFEANTIDSPQSHDPDFRRIQELKRRRPKPGPSIPPGSFDAINCEFDDVPPL